MQLLAKYPNLTYFCANNCSDLTSDCLDYLLAKNPSFTEIEISAVDSFVDKRLALILKNSKDTLKKFDFSYMPEEIKPEVKMKFDDDIFAHLGMCEKLQSVNFSGNCNISML